MPPSETDPLTGSRPTIPRRISGSVISHVQEQARQRPPAPKGRGIAIAVLCAAVLIAVIIQFTTSFGPGGAARRRVVEEKRASRVAPRAPEPRTTPRVELVDVTVPEPSVLPVPMPGASILLPEGLDETTAGRLRLALNGLTGPRIMAASGLRELPRIVAEASAAVRPTVRAFVVEKLAILVADPRLGTVALDAALGLVDDSADGLEPIAEAVRAGQLPDDTVTAAVVFLDALAGETRTASVPALLDIARAKDRPLHVRVLAARTLGRWDAVPEARTALAAENGTPEVLRSALQSGP